MSNRFPGEIATIYLLNSLKQVINKDSYDKQSCESGQWALCHVKLALMCLLDLNPCLYLQRRALQMLDRIAKAHAQRQCFLHWQNLVRDKNEARDRRQKRRDDALRRDSGNWLTPPKISVSPISTVTQKVMYP